MSGSCSFATTQRRRPHRQSSVGAHRPLTEWRRATAAGPGQTSVDEPRAKRETVAARHRKIANQRRDFHHKQARALVGRYDLLVVEDLQIANMLRRAKPVPDPDRLLGSSCRTAPGRSPGSTEHQ